MTTTLTQQIADSTATWNDPAGNWAAFNAALAAAGEEVYGIVVDQGDPDSPGTYIPGWSVLLDPTNCPAKFLPYCAMFNGTNVQPGTAEADARAIIKGESGFARGTAASIIAAAQRFLSGTQSAFLLERTPTPYHFTLVVRPEEAVNVIALTAAVDAVRPAGVQWTLIQTDGWALFQMEAFEPTITLLEAQFSTITGLENDQVGH